MIRFAARMAWRETRGAWRQFLGLLACVALGVAALVAVATFATTLDRTLAREAKALLGGDLELRAAHPLDDEARAALGRRAGDGAVAVWLHELVGMARAAPERGPAGSLLVELKVVDGPYPLYGRLQTAPAAPLADLLAGDGVVVQPGLLERLGLAVGDALLIGAGRFTVTGVLHAEPDRGAGLMTLGPRVLMSAGALPRTGLVQLGSRVRYRTLLRLPATVEPRAVRDALAREIADPGVRVVAFDEGQGGLRRFFTQLTTYLGLVGLASLLIGAVGVASAVATYMRRQVPTIAVLKCLGAGTRTLFTTYLCQMTALGGLGSLVGAALGAALQPVLIRLLAGVVPFTLTPALEPGTIVRGVVMGTLVTVLVALWPLARVRDVRPALVFRREVDADARGRPPWAAAALLALGLVGLVFWQAGSPRLGAIVAGAAVAALGLLLALAAALVRVARALPRRRGFAWTHGVASLARPDGQATRAVVAVGIGVTLLVAVALLESSLAGQIDHEQRREAPSFFFVDVQPDQREPFARLLREVAGTPPTLVPVVRARLGAIDGQPVTRDLVERRRPGTQEGRWYFTREYVLTWTSEPPATNVVTRGRWWTEAEARQRPRASVEAEAAAHLGVTVGSTLVFDVLGVPVEAEVMSLRKVDWQSFSTNFFVILSPGALDGAPATYVATARTPPGLERAVQDRVAAAFPNVTAIPVRDLLERVSGILGQIAVAVRVIALFSLGTGLAVMAGALAATRYQRLHESVVLRTLGATRAAVARAFVVEYACLGVVAGLGGSALASVLAWVVLRFVLDAPWRLEPATLAVGVAATMGLCVAVGFLGTFRLLGKKPLTVLRQE